MIASTILFNFNDLSGCAPHFCCPAKLTGHSDWDHELKNQKDPFWGPLTSHWNFLQPAVSVKQGSWCPSLRSAWVCKCTLDLLSREPCTRKYPTAPYTEPSVAPSPCSHTHCLLPSLSDCFLSSMRVTLWHTQFSAYWIWCALRGLGESKEKRVDNVAADDKRVEEGDKQQVWRSKKEFATTFVSDGF